MDQVAGMRDEPERRAWQAVMELVCALGGDPRVLGAPDDVRRLID